MEKEKNTATIADAQAAITAVEQATTVLKDFYAKAATATALTQMQSEGPADDAPETFDKPFTGVVAKVVLLVCSRLFCRIFSALKLTPLQLKPQHRKSSMTSLLIHLRIRQ